MDRIDNFPDRELFSELVEPLIIPVNPLFISVCPPSLKTPESPFELQIAGDALWEWRHCQGNSSHLFKALCKSLGQINYQLKPSCEERVSTCLKTHVSWLYNRMQKVTSSRIRKEIRSSTIKTIYLNIDEIEKGPDTIIKELRLEQVRMVEERSRLKRENDKKAEEIYNAMAKLKVLEVKQTVSRLAKTETVLHSRTPLTELRHCI